MNNNNNQEYPDHTVEGEKCLDFLQNFTVSGNWNKYMDVLREIKNRETKVLDINISDILDFKNDSDFANNIINNTNRYIYHFEKAADKILEALIPDVVHAPDVIDILKQQRQQDLAEEYNGDPPPDALGIPAKFLRRYEVAIVPPLTERPKKLREVKADDIGHLVKVKGMVTRTTDVKPKLTGCAYTCEVCGSGIFEEIVTNQFMPRNVCPSTRCKESKQQGKIRMNLRGSKFVKYQEVRLQELPDQVPVGHIPRSMSLHCRGELTRVCGPGDIVTVSGIFLTTNYRGYKARTAGLQADTYLEVTSVEKHKVGYGDMGIDKDTEDLVRKILNGPDSYNRLARSIAPEIYGHEDVKKALLLQLIGGATRVLADGMKIRGDINILLMGDPGVAKSQLLKYIASVAPRGVYTTGKGSSGVGLTAAVVRDNMTGELALEGGALVLADMGICCIDEFDKMDENDRTSIHEVMEQQTISIAKAGITTSLNARAAVLAAANPLYGRYNKRRSIAENVDLPNSLLSRFDLLFLILDKHDMESDLALAKHVLHVHKFLKNPDRAFTPLSPSEVKKCIAAAKTLDASVPHDLTNYIVEAYVTLRQNDAAGTGRVASKSNNQATMTARQLLSILRLSQALARLRLSKNVSHEDVDEAIRLTHASKSSLDDDGPLGPVEDHISAVYNIIRDYRTQQNSDVLAYAQVEMMVLKKGFNAQHLHTTLTEYRNLGVIHLDANGTHIIFDS